MKVFIYFLFSVLIFNKSFAKTFNAETFELQNGLKVYLIENKRAPIITQMIWYDVGSVDEEFGKSGLAHFVEHLMFKGTKKYRNNFFSNFISKNGGSQNAFTSYDYTAYYQTVPKGIIEKVIELEADRMKNLILSEDEVKTERNVILEERYQRIDSNSSSILDESMQKALFPNTNYGTPIIGWEHEIKSLTYNDVLEFYEKYYDPSNAIVIYSGDIDIKSLKVMTKKYFGKIKGLEKIERIKLVDPPMKTNIKIKLKDPENKQRVWKRFYKFFSYNDSLEKGIALDIGLKILAGGSTSILYDELVTKKKKFSSVGAYYNGLTKGKGLVYFYAVPNDGVEISEVETLINETIEQALRSEITHERFKIQKRKYFYDSIYLLDSISKPPQILGEALTVGLELDEIEEWNEHLNKISLSDIENELKSFFKNKNFVTGILE